MSGDHHEAEFVHCGRCKIEALQKYTGGLEDLRVEGTQWDTQQPLAVCHAEVDSNIAEMKKAEVRRMLLATCGQMLQPYCIPSFHQGHSLLNFRFVDTSETSLNPFLHLIRRLKLFVENSCPLNISKTGAAVVCLWRSLDLPSRVSSPIRTAPILPGF